MITFTRAPTVASGDAITSTQIAKLARAWNDRILLIGDIAWRFVMWHYNLWRQIRNPDASGLVFPAQGEVFDLYGCLDPEYHGGTTWPVTGPGEPEGANLANQMAQFVFGVDPDLDPEDVRLEICPLWVDGHAPSTMEDFWELGKLQRGAYDPSTGAQNVPAFTAAQDFFRVSAPYYSPHGKAYGGYFPMPTMLLEDCSDGGLPESEGYMVPSYAVKFTGLRADVTVPTHHGTLSYEEGLPVITYAGTCPCDSALTASGHVLWIGRCPFAYYVAVNTVSAGCTVAWAILPIADWIEGPYEGEAILQRSDGNQLHRAIWASVVDHRGTPDARGPAGTLGNAGLQAAGSDAFLIESLAFPFQEFHTRQYALAPNRGIEGGGSVVEIYPRVEFSGDPDPDVPPGTYGTFCHTGGSGTSHAYESGFVCAGFFAKATELAAPATVEFLSGDTVIGTLSLTPDPSGAAQALHWLATAVTPDPLRIRLPDGATFSSTSGSIEIEANELLEYLPAYWDAYLVLRLGATAGGPATGGSVDGRGIDSSLSNQIGRDLFRYGCKAGTGASGVREIAEWINDHPVYDAARRLTRDHCRILRRQAFDSYEVGADGKSVLYFKRFAYGMHEVRADLFHGIAPPLDPLASGSLIEGETYLVRGTTGSVTYDGTAYGPGAEFTATSTTTFTAGGDCQVYVKDGIRQTALPKGWTNRWVLFLQTSCYNLSESSVFKPTAFSDYFTWCERCLWHTGDAPSARFRFHVNYQYGVGLDPGTYLPFLLPEGVQNTFVSPEAPTGYRYGLDANQDSPDPRFLASCQMYEAPYEVESCTVHDWSDDQVVKVVLSRRLKAHPDAPATVALDPTSWSETEVDILRGEYTGDPEVNEDYRTDDNAVREYALQLSTAADCTFKIGDAGNNSSEYGSPSVNGSCYPKFLLARLMSEPYEDDNDTPQPADARCVVDTMLHAEILTRAGCEAFVDGQTSISRICSTPGYSGGLYDYTFEALCFEAFSGRWISAFPLSIRSDGPAGFGPLPNTIMYADVWNQLASSVNLLTRLRIDLPVAIYHNDHQSTVVTEVEPTYANDACSLNDQRRAWIDDAPQEQGTTDDSGWPTGWMTDSAIQAMFEVRMSGCPWNVTSTNWWSEYRTDIDSSFYDAVPTALLAHIQDGGVGFVAIQTDTITWYTRSAADPGTGDACASATPDFFTDGDGVPQKWEIHEDGPTTTCKLISAGDLVAPTLSTVDLNMGVEYIPYSYHQCGVTASHVRDLALVNERCSYLEFPLSDD